MCDPVSGARQVVGNPRWLTLYAVTLPQLGVLAAVEVAAFPSAVRVVARCVLALGTFVGMGWWVRSSRAALDLEQWCECAPRTVTVRITESRRPAHPLRMEPRGSIADRDPLREDTLVGV